MRILLIQPPLIGNNNINTADLTLTEPLALELLGANLPEYEVRILDMRIENNLDGVLADFNPHIVGLTAYTVDVYKVYKILEKIKEFNKEILTIVGGHHVSILPTDFDKNYVDVVILGEAEHSIREVVRAFEQKKDMRDIKGIGIRYNGELKLTATREIIEDLDSLPFANRKLTGKYRDKYYRGNWKQVASLYSSRGCPFKCDFCAMWKVFNGRFRIRTAKRFVDELETISEKYINFLDDNTLQNVNYAEDIYMEIKKRGIKKTYKLYGRSDTIIKRPDLIDKWKSIGMELLFVGLEAFRDEDLKARNKNNTVKNNEEAIKILHKNNVDVVAYFIVNQNFTKEDFDYLSKYVNDLKLRHPMFTILTPFPGTELYKKEYHQITTHNYELFDIFHSVLPTKLPLKEFYENFVNLYKTAYSNNNKFLSNDTINALVDKFVKAHNLS